jgi:hypothetical protein
LGVQPDPRKQLLTITTPKMELMRSARAFLARRNVVQNLPV